MHTSLSKPVHFIAPGSAIIEEHQFVIMAAVSSAARKLAISIPPECIDLMDVSLPQEIVVAAQHFPEYIERMLGTLHFDFQVKRDTDIFLPDEEWKMKRRYMDWFRAMQSEQYMPFFVKDKDVRLYMLAGDYIAPGSKSVVIKEEEPGRPKYITNGSAKIKLRKRLYDCCKLFLFYCHGSGFNPKEAIQSLLGDFNIPLHYGEIYKDYQKEIKQYVAVYNSPGHRYRFRIKKKE